MSTTGTQGNSLKKVIGAAEPAARQVGVAVIATRKRCEADGVGLSHYVLMDRRAGK